MRGGLALLWGELVGDGGARLLDEKGRAHVPIDRVRHRSPHPREPLRILRAVGAQLRQAAEEGALGGLLHVEP